MARRDGGYEYGDYESDGDDSDSDSGFEDGFSTDESMLARISKMRDMMSLHAAPRTALAAGNTSAAPPPTQAQTQTAKAATPTGGSAWDEAAQEQQQPSVQPSGQMPSPQAVEEAAPFVVRTPREDVDIDEGSFLVVDKAQALSLSDEKQQQQPTTNAPVESPRFEAALAAAPPAQAYASNAPQHAAPAQRKEEEHEQEEQEEQEEEEEDRYAVTWSRGQLGILFKEGPGGITMIRRVNKRNSTADGLHAARAGDVLVAIDGASTRGRGFQELVEQLRLPDFPVTLHFEPLKDSDDEPDPNYQQPKKQPIVQQTTSEAAEMWRKQSSVSATSSSAMSFQESPQSPQSLHPLPVPVPFPAPVPAPEPAPALEAQGQPQPQPQPSPFAISQEEAVAAYRLNYIAPNYATPPVRSSSLQYATAYTPVPSDFENIAPDEYVVEWRQGSLGCGVKQINGLPTIKSVTPGAAVDVSVQQLEAGDVMVWINGSRTETLGFRPVVEIMQRAPKPLYMRFRRASGAPAAPPAYNHVLPPAPVPIAAPSPPRATSDHASVAPVTPSLRQVENLRESRVGMEDMLEASLGSNQYTVLWERGPLGVQIKARPSDGAVIVAKFTGTGDPDLCAQIHVGDVFIRIAGVEVANLGVSGTHELLRTVHKPIVVVFERVMPPRQYAVSPPRMPSPSAAPPSPAGPRPVFDTGEDPSESAVPSFRVLRERQAAAERAAQQHQQQLRGRESFAGFSSEQRGDVIFGAAGRRAAHDKHRPASYDNMAIDERWTELGSGIPPRHDSFANKSDHMDRHSERSYQSGDNNGGGARGSKSGSYDGGHAAMEDPQLPRFSDIETGRVQTTSVSSLPPPPAYSDVFTQSGRALDPRLLTTPVPTSPRSDDHPHRHKSKSVESDPHPQRSPYTRDSQTQLQSPPRYQPPPSPPLNMSMAPYTQPPPAYDQHLGDPRSQMRVDLMRQHYLQSERARNTQPQSRREPSPTQFSSYSDLDDSGIMAAYRRPQLGGIGGERPASPSSPAIRRRQAPPHSYSQPQQPAMSRQSVAVENLATTSVSVLPPPELWIHWSEGPLGITFRRTNGQIVVSRLTGAGYSRGIEQLRSGDWLMSFGSPGVGSYVTNELRLNETMDLIKSLPKPVEMCFIVR